jgi:hypothetical protein
MKITLIGCRGRAKGTYKQEIEQMARMQMEGRDISEKVQRCADIHNVEFPLYVELDIMLTRAAWYDSRSPIYRSIKAAMEKGKTEYKYKHQVLPIDEALRLEEKALGNYIVKQKTLFCKEERDN